MEGNSGQEITRERLVELLNEDLAREYQAIISYIVFSQAIKGAQFMTIAEELEVHAQEELQHAIMIAKQIDYFGATPTMKPAATRMGNTAEEMLRIDLDHENVTVRNYRERVRQAEMLGEFGLASELRTIITQEQEHQIDLATALGIEVPKEGLGCESASTEAAENVSAT